MEVGWRSLLGHLVGQGGKLPIGLVHCVEVEARRVVFDCWVLGWDEEVVLFALVPLVGHVELGLAARWVVHLLLHDVPEHELLSTAFLSAHQIRDIVGGLQGMVVAGASLRDGVVGFALFAEQRRLGGCEDLQINLEPANPLGVSEELQQLDFVDWSIL